MLDSEPVGDKPPPEARVRGEAPVLHCGIYRREIAHRSQKRKSFLTTKL